MSKVRSITGVDINEMLAEAAIEAHRYPDASEHILARHGESVETLFPSADELKALGFDITVIGSALESGQLDGQLFGQALARGLKGQGFSELVRSAGDGLNGALVNFGEAALEQARHQHQTDRVLHRLGECLCFKR